MSESCEQGAERTWDEDHGWVVWQGCLVHGANFTHDDAVCDALIDGAES